MLTVNIICVGKLKEKFWVDACKEYAKRLQGFCRFNIVEVDEEKTVDNPNESQIGKILACEGERIIKKLSKGSKVIAMCIEGKIYSSPEIAHILDNIAVEGVSTIDFVIGGSWGLSDAVKRKASIALSMSKMTFPHQLARVMLCEQIYRGFQISTGGKYHK